MQVITTISINWNMPFKRRLKLFPRLLLSTYYARRELKIEYAEWQRLGVFQNRWHKLLYILDHFVIWWAYCIIALLRGEAKGFKWERQEDYLVWGVKIDL